MQGRFLGRRGKKGNEWVWDKQPARPGRSGRRRLRLLIASLAIIALVAGAFFAAVSETGDGGESAQDVASGTPSPQFSPSPLSATASPSPQPSPTPVLGLMWWDRTGNRWRADPVSGPSGYREGDVMPFLMRMEGAVEDSEYEVAITYAQCDDTAGTGFDFLTGAGAAGDPAPLASGGPGSGPPDATIAIPDDPATMADDTAFRFLRLWGGTFEEAPEGPLADCSGGRSVGVKVFARSRTVILIWGSHLASRDAWPGAGAASRETAFFQMVQAEPAGEAVVQVSPGAISP